MNTYFLCITQPSNLGDLIINKMLIDELSKYGKVFVDCYKTPERFRKKLFEGNDKLIDVSCKYGFSLKKLDLLRTLIFFKKHHIELFTSSPGPIEASPKSFSLKKMAFNIINLVIRLSGVKHYAIGNCCTKARLEQQIIDKSYIDKYYLRSIESVEYVNQLGCQSSYIPDLAYLYRERVTSCTNKDKVVAMSFRKPTDDMDSFLKWFENTVRYLISEGYDIELYYQVESDKAFMKTLAEIFVNNNVKLLEPTLWYENLSFYENKCMIISNRLHCLIMGVVNGAIPVAVLKEDKSIAKIKDVFTSSFMGYGDCFIVNYASLDFIKEIVQNYEELSEKINKIANYNLAICQNQIKDISKIQA